MILVDTSVWVNHFRTGDPRLAQLLSDGDAGLHPFVIGEIAAGNLNNRAVTLNQLELLNRTPIASEGEVHHLMESRRLWGSGLGWVDLHVLASALLSGCKIYTVDRAMNRVAESLGIAGPHKASPEKGLTH